MSRSCGGCAVCCTVMGVTELGKKARVQCEHESSWTMLGERDGRCGSYASRPESCAKFSCAWLQGALRLGDRPDSLGVMLTGAQPGNVLARDLGFDMVVAHEVTPGALDLEQARAALQRLSRSRVVLLLGVDGNERVIGPEKQMRRLVKWNAKQRRIQ